MRSLLRKIGFVVIILYIGQPLRAYSVTDSCVSYTASNEEGPADIQKYVKAMPKGAVLRRCTNSNGINISLTSPTISEQSGICRFDEIIFSSDDRGNPTAATLYFTHMLVTRSGCPDQGDRNFISTEGISEGLFRILLRGWKKLRDSPQEIDPTNDAISSLKSSLLAHPTQLNLSDIHFVPTGQSHVGKPAYEMFVQDVADKKIFLLTVDIMEEKLRILRVDVLPI